MDFREFVNRLRMAHVGAVKNSDDGYFMSNDRPRFDRLCLWMMQNDEETWEAMHHREDVFIDLGAGRDFLKEHDKYDVVILHMVWCPEEYDIQRYTRSQGFFQISHLHSKQEWKKRLIETGAKYIFAFGSQGEVSADYLEMLPGYDVPEEVGWEYYVYKKLD